MAKDPAFLLYYKDILVSCAEWPSDYLGWYLRLLCHQADKQAGLKADLESLALLAGVKFSDYNRFVECWEHMLKHRFELTEGGLLQDIVQARHLDDRREYKDKQAIRGLVGYYSKIMRQKFHLTEDQIKEVTPRLFKALSIENTKADNEHAFKRTLEAYIGNANAIGNGIVIPKEDRGVGKGMPAMGLLPQMMQLVKEHIPTYPMEQDSDFPPCLQIAQKIASQKGWPKESVTGDHAPDILKIWKNLVVFASKNDWYQDKSISFIANKFQDFVGSYRKSKKDHEPKNNSGGVNGVKPTKLGITGYEAVSLHRQD